MPLRREPTTLHAVPSVDAPDDRDCVAAIARGDRAAFETLYRRYYERLFRFALRVTGRIAGVDDIVAETLIVVWRNAGEYRATSAVSTWIFGIAYRKALKALARERRANTPPEESSFEPVELSAADQVDAESVRAAIVRAIADLPPEHRAVVELTFHFNRSYQDIAEILDCPVGTVKSRMFHARAKLRPLLAHLLGD
jgi:RNA polymerase sigma-70 factor (ECF subfamily)